MQTPSAGHLTEPRKKCIDPRNAPPLAPGSWHRRDFIYPEAPAHFSDKGRQAYDRHRRNYEGSSATWPAAARDAWFVKLRAYMGDTTEYIETTSLANHPVVRQVLNGSGTWAHVVFLREQYRSRGRLMSSQRLLGTLCEMYPGAPADFGTDEWSEAYLVAPDGMRSSTLLGGGGGSWHGNDSKGTTSQGGRLDFERFYADFSLPGKCSLCAMA